MTTPSTARKAGPFLGTGSQTAWPFTFKVFAASDVAVTIANSSGVETALELDTDYSVSLNANQESSPGGTVTYPISGSALPAGSKLSITGDIEYDQGYDIPSGGNFNPVALENQLDRATMQIQQLKEEIDRAAKLPVTNGEDPEALVEDLVRLADSADNIDTVVANLADITTVADDLNEPVSEINTVAGAITNVNNVGNNIASVNTVAGISANVTTVANIGVNVTAVAGNAANITAVAGNATNITAVAGNEANIDTVAGISSNVTTVAGISSDVSTVAAISGDVAAVENIAANVTTVAGIAANVTTVAGIAANVTTVAGNNTNVTAVGSNIAAVTSNAANMGAIQNASANAVAVQGALAQVNNGTKQRFVAGVGYTKNTTTQLTLTSTPAKPGFVQVFFDGVYQNSDKFTLAGAVITFTSAIPADTVEVAYDVPVTLTEDAAWRLADARLREGFRKEKATPIAPTLLLDFSGDEQLDPRITFTRASTATYYDGKTVAKAEQNLLSESDSPTLITPAATTRTNASAVAPNNSTTAFTVVPTTDNVAHASGYAASNALLAIAGQNLVISFYAKASGYKNLRVGGAGTNNCRATYDLDALTISDTGGAAFVSSTIIDAGNGWRRITIVYNSTTTAFAFRFCPFPDGATVDGFGRATFAGDGTSGMQFWGFQAEQRDGTLPTAYTPTTAQGLSTYVPVLLTAANNVARFDHNPLTGESLGLLTEEQRTNLNTYSEQPDNAAWSKLNTTITANAVVAPDGTVTADKLVENTATTSHILAVPSTTAYVSGSTYTASIYLKKGERSIVGISQNTFADFGSTWRYAVFDLNAGTIVNQVADPLATITHVGNGWYRCTITLTATASATGRLVRMWLSNGATTLTPAYTGDGFSGVYVWGAQSEAGAFATNYIKTEASQVTRAADVASIAGTNWYTPSAGTFFVDSQVVAAGNTVWTGLVRYVNSTNRTDIGRNGESWQGWTFQGANVPSGRVFDTASGYVFGAPVKIAHSFKLGETSVMVVNGSTPAVGTAVGVTGDITTTFTLGRTGFEGRQYFRKLAFYPQKLADAQLQTLTT
jgi:hypothetical protein